MSLSSICLSLSVFLGIAAFVGIEPALAGGADNESDPTYQEDPVCLALPSLLEFHETGFDHHMKDTFLVSEMKRKEQVVPEFREKEAFSEDEKKLYERSKGLLAEGYKTFCTASGGYGDESFDKSTSVNFCSRLDDFILAQDPVLKGLLEDSMLKKMVRRRLYSDRLLVAGTWIANYSHKFKLLVLAQTDLISIRDHFCAQQY